MIHSVLKNSPSWTWIDIANPSKDELDTIADKFQLHKKLVADCLDSTRLPKFERFQNGNFLILRTYDEKAAARADTVQYLTHKVAFFLGTDFLITIHRVDQVFLQVLRDKWEEKSLQQTVDGADVLYDIIRETLRTYQDPLNDVVEKMAMIENGVFNNHKNDPAVLKKIFFLKRKTFVFKRLLLMTIDIFSDIPLFTHDAEHRLQGLREEAHKVFFLADELVNDLNSLLNFHLSLSQNRTNDIMRTLTLITVFFIPLTFVVGIYGMNFHFMPELSWKWGYTGVWGLMLASTAAIYFWIRRKGWFE